MTQVERDWHSRVVLEARVMRAVRGGASLATIAADKDMPRRNTLRRWIEGSPEWHEMFVAAIAAHQQTLIEDLVAEADRQAARARGRRRITALRSQIAARNQWLRLMARQRPDDAGSDARGISPEGVRILENAAEPFTRPWSPSAPSPVSAETDSSFRHPRAPLFEGPRASGPMGGDPRVSVGDQKQHVDARPAAQSAALDPRVEPGATGSRPENDEEEAMAGKEMPSADHNEKEQAAASNESDASHVSDEDDDMPAYAPEDARYRSPDGRVAPRPYSKEQLAPDTESPPSDDSPAESDVPQGRPLQLTITEEQAVTDPLGIPPRSPRAADPEQPQYHHLPLSVGEEEALRAKGIEPPQYRPVRIYDDTDEPRYHRLPLTVAEEEALKARLAGKPLPPAPEKKSSWKPDTPTTVRFDIGGGYDVSNQRDRSDGMDMAHYDPFTWRR